MSRLRLLEVPPLLIFADSLSAIGDVSSMALMAMLISVTLDCIPLASMAT